MAIPYEQVLAEESEETQMWVKQRAAELIAEEMNLRELRRALKLTQARLSKKLKIGQEGVSRIERRSDMNLSTLRSYVEGLGGKLRIMVELPDQPPLILSGLGSYGGAKKPKKKAGSGAKSKAKTRRAA
jgi:DNA-binding XRE family transcriptional regulator